MENAVTQIHSEMLSVFEIPVWEPLTSVKSYKIRVQNLISIWALLLPYLGAFGANPFISESQSPQVWPSAYEVVGKTKESIHQILIVCLLCARPV